MSYPLKVIILEIVEIFIREKLSTKDEAKLYASITAIRLGNYDNVFVKPLKDNIKELIIKNYRFIFFIDNEIVYFSNAFIKKTNKTPKIEMEKVKKIYKIIHNKK